MRAVPAASLRSAFIGVVDRRPSRNEAPSRFHRKFRTKGAAGPVGVLRRVRPRRGVAGGRVAAGGRLGRHVAALPRLVSRLLRRTLLKFDQRWSVFGCIGTDFANKS